LGGFQLRIFNRTPVNILEFTYFLLEDTWRIPGEYLENTSAATRKNPGRLEFIIGQAFYQPALVKDTESNESIEEEIRIAK
jgi:hypothetical protein